VTAPGWSVERKVDVMKKRIALAMLATALPLAASAQEEGARTLSDAELIGEPAEGLALSRDVCAQCHAIVSGDRDSPMPSATAFQKIAETPGMTSRALTVWLTTFHPERTMPAIRLTRDEREDVIAHILTLREEN